jgi:hypothetical protein
MSHPQAAARSLSLLWPLLALLAVSSTARGQVPEDPIAERWYFTEILIFTRPGVLDFTVEEDLVRYEGAEFPRLLRSLQAADGRIGAYDLDAQTQASLELPRMDGVDLRDGYDLPDRGTPEPRRDPTTPAGAPPPAIEPVLEPDPLLDLLRRRAEFEARLQDQSYRWLDPSSFTLTGEFNRLNRSGNHEVLLHGRWLQPVPPRQSPQPLLVQAGPRYRDAFGLEGSVGVTLGRFLHFRTDLYYREPLLGSRPLDRAQPPPGVAPAPDGGPTLRDLSTAGFMQIRESRRMRSGELHYLDHPKLGVLVRIEPFVPPQELSVDQAAVEERPE